MSGRDGRSPAGVGGARGLAALVWVSLAARCVVAIGASMAIAAPDLVLASVLGALLYLVDLWLLRRASLDLVVFSIGAEWSLHGLLCAATLGGRLEFQLLVPLLSVSVLVFEHVPIRTRIVMAAIPVAAMAILSPSVYALAPSVELSVDADLAIASLNFLFFVGVMLLVAAHAIRSAELARREAERLARRQSQLIADMSHELRTPIAGSLTIAQACLARDREAADYRAVLEDVVDGLRDQGQLIERMLDLARVDDGLEVVDLSADLDEELEDSVARFRPVATTRGVALELRHDPLRLQTDATIFGIVLGNLLANAIRFSPERATVEITAGRPGGAARIDVRDHGPGIDPAHLPHVFDRYWRADKARSRREGHAGLGLAIAAEYATLLGARLEVESTPGAGATFSLIWPR